MKRKSGTAGQSTLKPEVSAITRQGIWLIVEQIEYFAPFIDFPWFKSAPAQAIFDLRMPHKGHLRWPALDIDLHLDSLVRPDAFPLIAKPTKPRRKQKKSA